MLRILPSIASADQLHLCDELERIRDVHRLHIDIEDGNFVNNITFGKRTVLAISKVFDGEMDAHLMTTDPLSCLPWLADAGVRAVCAHLEALPYPLIFLNRARAMGFKAGLAINLKVNLCELNSYLPHLDYVLVMTSEPDDGDQAFFPYAVERVSQLRSMLPDGTEIWCDGGIKPELLSTLAAAGMNVAVMGRAVFSALDPAEAVREYEGRLSRI